MISKEEKVLYHDNGNLININGINYIKQSAKEEIRAERDEEIIEMLEGEISYSQEMNYLGSEDVRIEVLKEIKEWIEENK